jgi:hypothetical protein
MLSWNSRHDAEIDNFDGDHHHLYQEVLSSTGLLADKDTIPALDSFPIDKFFLHLYVVDFFQNLQMGR